MLTILLFKQTGENMLSLRCLISVTRTLFTPCKQIHTHTCARVNTFIHHLSLGSDIPSRILFRTLGNPELCLYATLVGPDEPSVGVSSLTPLSALFSTYLQSCEVIWVVPADRTCWVSPVSTPVTDSILTRLVSVNRPRIHTWR